MRKRVVEFEKTEKDPLFKALCCIKGIITPTGIIGHHLKLEPFQGSIPNRPHLHWSWNQLVQPHTTASWENSLVALFEPLSTFENDSFDHKPYSIAAYDTMTIGSHSFSNRSTLLIPDALLSEVEAYVDFAEGHDFSKTPTLLISNDFVSEVKAYLDLPNFEGRIVTYQYDPEKPYIRSAVIDTLEARYPETWHICDANGKLVGREATKTAGGHGHVTCLKTADGEVHILFKGSGGQKGEIESNAIKTYKENKRGSGYHDGSPTDIEKEPYFNSLKSFSSCHESIKNNTWFAGYVSANSLANVGVLEALKLYHDLLQQDAATGMH
ncbi:MAG: hypothetical protein ACRDFB_07340, partial [Rhabdochlamydiaceae bacterium]